MQSVFLTGPSGTGKSTFLKKLEKNTCLKMYTEITRADNTILRTHFATRQMFFALSYSERHKKSLEENFLSDRTILDYIFWTAYNGSSSETWKICEKFVPLVAHLFNIVDRYVVVELPNTGRKIGQYRELFRELIFPNFLNDPFRYAIYIGKHNDIYGHAPYTHDEFNDFLFKMSFAMMGCIQGMLELIDKNFMNSNMRIIKTDGSIPGFWGWQDDAYKQVMMA